MYVWCTKLYPSLSETSVRTVEQWRRGRGRARKKSEEGRLFWELSEQPAAGAEEKQGDAGKSAGSSGGEGANAAVVCAAAMERGSGGELAESQRGKKKRVGGSQKIMGKNQKRPKQGV